MGEFRIQKKFKIQKSGRAINKINNDRGGNTKIRQEKRNSLPEANHGRNFADRKVATESRLKKSAFFLGNLR
jgi:hypothetical protein